MLRLVRWLLGMCEHRWVEKERRTMSPLGSPEPKPVIGLVYVHECERCGKMREFRVMAN